MGTTLEHGVYLPDEGERNCYAGLKVNWETLDQKVADISALQSAIAGALHREIVATLPTTDIDPNTIYMILSGTSATENVYNEFMYVNNAWELIGTSATDLTNYYTKSEVDGKLLLKASASDLTSHTGDTTIHVTASDKAKWNTVALIKQLRLVNTQVGSATTIAFANIDDTNGIKVGDKCMDLDGKMFEITAVDTTNETVTVGSALIDIALDPNVVHNSGAETIGGIKSFSDDTYIKSLNFTNEVASPSSSSTAIMPLVTTVTYTDQTASKVARINLRITASGDKSLYPHENNLYALGLTSRKWSEIHGVTYYYGSSDTEFSDKFVTTDTAQTISGVKTFSGVPVFKSFDGLRFRCVHNSNAYITFRDANQANPGSLILSAHDGNVNTAIHLVNKALIPYNTNDMDLGITSRKWKSFNGLEPSSLGMPNLDSGVDISSYLDTSQSSTNTYTPSVNGWISIKGRSSATSGIVIIQDGMSQMGQSVVDFGSSDRVSFCALPVKAGVQVTIWLKSVTSLDSAKFYPCLGNV